MNLKQKKKRQVEQLMREEISAAVCRIMSETSFLDMKMSDIAKEAGVSKGTLYNYFESKEDLFLFLIDAIEADSAVFTDAILNNETLSARDKLVQYIKGIFDFAQSNVSWIILFYNYANEFSALEDKRKQSFEVGMRRVLHLFNDGIKNREWVIEKPETRAWLLVLLIMESVHELITNPDNSPPMSDIIEVLIASVGFGCKEINENIGNIK